MTVGMQGTRNIGREIGTAFAVLAIYLLTLLAPLHQARASQLVFEELGYTTSTTGWVLCSPAGQDDADTGIAKCPAAGIGKNDLLLPSLVALPAGLERVALAHALPPTPLTVLPAATAPSGGPRAPPASV